MIYKNKGQQEIITYSLKTLSLSCSDLELEKQPEKQSIFNSVPISKPSDQYYYNGLGLVCLTKGEFMQAYDHFKRAVDINPKFQSALLNLAEVHKIYNQNESAMQIYKIVQQLNPSSILARCRKADLQYATKNYQEALLEYNSLIREHPELGFGYYKRAQIYVDQGRKQQAIQDLTQSISMEESAIKYCKRANIYSDSLNFRASIEDFEKGKSLLHKQTDNQLKQFYEKSTVCVHLDQIKKVVDEDIDLNKTIKDISFFPERNQYLQNSLAFKRQLGTYLRYQQKNGLNNEKTLLELLKKQNEMIIQLKNKVDKLSYQNKYNLQNYAQRFRNKIQNSTYKEENKQKLAKYYYGFVSKMERYYLSAKLMAKIEDSHITFETISQNLQKGIETYQSLSKRFAVLKDIYQNIEELIAEIPYIGTAFGIIKKIGKSIDWVNKKGEVNQSKNIQHIASNITEFNDLSSRLAYYLTFHFEHRIFTARKQDLELQDFYHRLKRKYEKIEKKILNKVTVQKIEDQNTYLQLLAEKDVAIIMYAFSVSRLLNNIQNIEQKAAEVIKQFDQMDSITIYKTEEIQLEEALENSASNKNQGYLKYFQKNKCQIF